MLQRISILKVKVIIFDLDDTLYNEITYVYSGFKEVSKYFSHKHNFDETLFYNYMIDILNEFGRGKVFDFTLKEFDIYKKVNVKKALSLYRNHMPTIELPKESREILKYFINNGIPIYIVTDGNKVVQYKKFQALNLEQYTKKIFITHRYGIKHAKPSTYCFEKIAKVENVNFNDVVYIGDNINKDFVNIKKIGFQTIRIKNGMFKNIIKNSFYHASIDMDSLDELMGIIKT